MNAPAQMSPNTMWQEFRLLAMRTIYAGVSIVLLFIFVLYFKELALVELLFLSAAIIGFMVAGLRYRQQLAPEWINFMLLAVVGLITAYAIRADAASGVYWMYPVLAMVFFMFDRAIFVLVIMLIYALFAYVCYTILPFDYALRLGVSMLVLIGVGSMFLVMMLKMQSSLSYLTKTDQLTGAYQREYLTDFMLQQIERSSRDSKAVSLIKLDVDKFRDINDRFGYMLGEEVIRETANRLRRVLRGQDMIIRDKGAAFTIILPDTNLNQAAAAVERILAEIRSEPFKVKSMLVTVTASAGVAQWHKGYDWGKWLELAEDAMDLAKRGGRNRAKLAH